MANDVTKNPLVLDTAADDILTGDLWIQSIIWDANDGTADDVAQLEDGSERVIWKRTIKDVGTAANQFIPPMPCDTFPGGFKVKGLSLGQIDSGVLYVYYNRTGGIK